MSERPALAERLVLPALLLIGAATFLHGLGDSSYFVDEVASVEHALPPFDQIREVVRTTETTPYLYFFGLHGWLYNGGSPAEADARASSAIGGVLLLAAVYWTARAFLPRRRALLATALCLVSPLVLEYAQQVRVYVWVMLAVTVAVGATLRGGRLLWLGALAAGVAVCLHYTSLLVILPLCVWVVTRGELTRWARAGYVIIIAAAEALVLPTTLNQYRLIPNGGLVANGELSLSSATRILATPFDGRWTASTQWPHVVGALVLVVVAAVLLRRGDRLLPALAFLPLLGLLLVGVLGKDIMISRYTAVAAPLLLIALAALPVRALPVLAVALVAIAGGLVKSHGASGRYAPAREAIDHVAASYRPGDTLVVPDGPGANIPLGYYAQRRLSPLPPFIYGRDLAAIKDDRRLWLIGETQQAPARLRASADDFLRSIGYRAAQARAIRTSTTFVVVLAVPQGR